MKDKFNDIVDYAFTAQMEERLDKVEEGEANWKKVLSDFYGGFEAELHQAEQDLDGGAHQGARRGFGGDLSPVRAEPGHQVRPVRPLPGLSRLAGVRLHHAAGGGDAGQVPQVRRASVQAHGQEQKDQQAVHLLLL